MRQSLTIRASPPPLTSFPTVSPLARWVHYYLQQYALGPTFSRPGDYSAPNEAFHICSLSAVAATAPLPNAQGPSTAAPLATTPPGPDLGTTRQLPTSYTAKGRPTAATPQLCDALQLPCSCPELQLRELQRMRAMGLPIGRDMDLEALCGGLARLGLQEQGARVNDAHQQEGVVAEPKQQQQQQLQHLLQLLQPVHAEAAGRLEELQEMGLLQHLGRREFGVTLLVAVGASARL